MVKIEPVKSPCYCISFRRAANTLTRYYDRAFAAVALTANQFFLLNSIHQLGSCNKSELAQYTGLERTTIIRNLDVLLRKGLIAEIPGATQRNGLIRLSESGQKSMTEGAVIWKRLQSNVKQVLGHESKPVLWEIFERVDALDKENDFGA